jgi:PAS domain S-box-containing protein
MTQYRENLPSEIAERLRFETLVADLSSRFINLRSDEVDAEIEDAQRRVCECLGCDLSGLWQWSPEDPYQLTMTHLYRPLGGPPVPEPMDAKSHFPWCQEQVLAGKVVAVSSLEDVPAEAARDREVWEQFGIKTCLTLPLSFGGGIVVGAVSFNNMLTERTWPEEIVRRLQLIAQIFTNALVRKRSDEELRASEERLNLAADAAGAGLWILNLADEAFWMTDKTREMFGFAPDEQVKFDRFLGLVHPEDRGAIREGLQEILQSQNEDNSQNGGTVEYRVVRPDGSVRWFMSRGRPRFNSSGRPDRLMGVSLEITDRKQAEEICRDFSRRLINAHEEERARLARELHDDVTQRLAGMAIDAARAEREGSPAALHQIMRALQEGLVRMSEDIHALSYRLHPTLLADLGLTEAIKVECERVSRQKSIRVTVDLGDVPEAIPRNVALCLFRVTQEALRNVVRHAAARTITVSLRGGDDGLELAVRDDGVGFDAALEESRSTLGLIGLRERVHLVGGRINIDSEPSKGTTVSVRAPLTE